MGLRGVNGVARCVTDRDEFGICVASDVVSGRALATAAGGGSGGV